ncbi:1339_t:CDS:1, partial [Acaulospora colombiana]
SGKVGSVAREHAYNGKEHAWGDVEWYSGNRAYIDKTTSLDD